MGGISARYTPERIGMLSMLCLVVVFGVHSFVDWTWYVPGDAFVALLCAGWLAGRGPLGATVTAAAPAGAAAPGERSAAPIVRIPRSLREVSPMRVGVAMAAVIAALLAAWSQWQPQRSVDASQEALAQLATNPRAALAERADGRLARSAVGAGADHPRDDPAGRRASPRWRERRCSGRCACSPPTRRRGSRSPGTTSPREPAAALKELQAAIYLNPESIAPEAIAPATANPESVEIYNDYVQALRATSGTAGVGSVTRRAEGSPRTARGAPARASARGDRARPSAAVYQRDRTARASSSRRAPGGPAAARTATS